MTSSPRAVLLDADGVLQHPSHDWEAALADVGGAAFPAAVFEHERPAMRGEMTMREAVLAAAQAVGSDIDVDDTLTLWGRFDLDEEALSVVDELRALGYPCYLTTNQQDVRVAAMRERYANRLDGYFFSCEVGEAKPAGQYFVRVLETLGLQPGDCVFVDDSPANVRSASGVGLRSHLLDASDNVASLRAALRNEGLLPD